MPETLLGEIDAEAEASGTKRSGEIREAATVYLRERREADAAAARRARVKDAMAVMREISAEPQKDSRSTLEILREVRDLGPEDGSESSRDEVWP